MSVTMAIKWVQLYCNCNEYMEVWEGKIHNYLWYCNKRENWRTVELEQVHYDIGDTNWRLGKRL